MCTNCFFFNRKIDNVKRKAFFMMLFFYIAHKFWIIVLSLTELLTAESAMKPTISHFLDL